MLLLEQGHAIFYYLELCEMEHCGNLTTQAYKLIFIITAKPKVVFINIQNSCDYLRTIPIESIHRVEVSSKIRQAFSTKRKSILGSISSKFYQLYDFD